MDIAMELETNASKGLAREHSLMLQRGVVPKDSVVRIAQTFRSGTNDIDAVDFLEMFLEDERQTNLDTLNELYVLVNFRPAVTCKNCFAREEGEGPTLYPVACAPQAWSAASVFLLFQACLGLKISGIESKISFFRPSLPSFLNEARIHNLHVGGASVDLALVRHGQDISVNVLHKQGDVEIIVVM